MLLSLGTCKPDKNKGFTFVSNSVKINHSSDANKWANFDVTVVLELSTTVTSKFVDTLQNQYQTSLKSLEAYKISLEDYLIYKVVSLNIILGETPANVSMMVGQRTYQK